MFKAIIFLLVSYNVFSIDTDAEGYRFSQNEYAKMELFGSCRYVHQSGLITDTFVTTKTTEEWTAFFTNPPGGMLAGACSGIFYPGSYTHSAQKFYLAKDNDSCDTRCSALGGCVAGGFALITSLADCQTVVEGVIGATPTYSDGANPAADVTTDPDTNPNSPSTTLGCTFFESTDAKVGATQVRRFTTNAATCSAETTTAGYQRACPCTN